MIPSDPQTENVSATEQRLRSLVAEYEARLKEITELVVQVRHEINNPLTGVIGQAQLLLREDLSDKARQRVKTIEQLATRIKETVAQLRRVQRPPTQSPDNGNERDASPRREKVLKAK